MTMDLGRGAASDFATSQSSGGKSPSSGTSSASNPVATPRRAPRILKSSPYPAVLGKGLLAAAKIAVTRWDHALENVREVQEAALVAITRHASGTEYGRRQDFAGVKSYAQFKTHVPLNDYDTFSPFIERMRKGEKNLLVPEFVRYFGNSSGSSQAGRPKFLPITDRQIGHQRRAGADTLMRWLDHTNDDQFVRGYTLGLFPPPRCAKRAPSSSRRIRR